MIHHRIPYCLAVLISLCRIASGQVLEGDRSFPILNEMRWEMTHDDVRNFCEAKHVLVSSTDSVILAGMQFFGSSARAEIAFSSSSAGVHDIRIKFDQTTKEMADTLINHFTALTGKAPIRQTKEKSILIMTLKMEIAGWKLSNGSVVLIAAKRNEEIFDLYLTLFPHAKEKS